MSIPEGTPRIRCANGPIRTTKVKRTWYGKRVHYDVIEAKYCIDVRNSRPVTGNRDESYYEYWNAPNWADKFYYTIEEAEAAIAARRDTPETMKAGWTRIYPPSTT